MPQSTLITGRAEMRRALAAVKPASIAVAYVGAGWRKLLGKNSPLKEIVLSPCPGTNPWAIEEIAKVLDWENVHFLEQLHAKVYLGRHEVLLGSANLSSNALDSGRADLYELVLHSDDRQIVSQARREFERYRDLARKEYRSTAAKILRVETLKRAQPEIDRTSKKFDRRSAPNFGDFLIGSERIYLEWWDGESDEGGDDGDIDFMDMILGKEKIRPGDWMLTWRCRPNGRPGSTAKVEWLRIDEIRPKRGEDEDYSDQVAQTHRHLVGAEPFLIDDSFKMIFRQEIKKFKNLMPMAEAPMVTPARKQVDALLHAIRDQN